MMRRFRLIRKEDVTGVSGVGAVAEGVQFSNGKCVMHWTTQYASICIYDDINTLYTIHGHNGSTIIQWIDDNGASFGALEPSFIVESSQGAKIAEGIVGVHSTITLYLPNETLSYKSSAEAWSDMFRLFGHDFKVIPVADVIA